MRVSTRLLGTFVFLCTAWVGIAGQEKPLLLALELVPVLGPDGKPFAAEYSALDRSPLGPGDGAYFTLRTSPLAGRAWHLDGTKCVEVLVEGEETAAERDGPQIIETAGTTYLVTRHDRLRRFWKLDGSKGQPVLDAAGKPFAIYPGNYVHRDGLFLSDGESRASIPRLFEISGLKAVEVEIKREGQALPEFGIFSQAWRLDGKLLVSFGYRGGNARFYWLIDGLFVQTGETVKVDTTCLWNNRLFVGREGSAGPDGMFVITKDGMKPLKDDRLVGGVARRGPGAVLQSNKHGVYFCAKTVEGKFCLCRSEGESIILVADQAGKPLIRDHDIGTTCAGSCVFASSGTFTEWSAWVVDRDKAAEVFSYRKESGQPHTGCKMLAALPEGELLEFDKDEGVPSLALYKWPATLQSEVSVIDAPQDFHGFYKLWNVREGTGRALYGVEFGPGGKYRFWLVRRANSESKSG